MTKDIIKFCNSYIPLGMCRSVERNNNNPFVKTRFYLVLPMLTGSTCRNRRHEVEPRTNGGRI